MSWVERAEAEEFKFEEEGDSITGLLVKCAQTQYGSKVYTLIKADGSQVYFFGCAQLDELLPRMLSKYVQIEYKGKVAIEGGRECRQYSVKQWLSKAGNVPKGFEHWVEPKPKEKATPPTEQPPPEGDDIPF